MSPTFPILAFWGQRQKTFFALKLRALKNMSNIAPKYVKSNDLSQINDGAFLATRTCGS